MSTSLIKDITRIRILTGKASPVEVSGFVKDLTEPDLKNFFETLPMNHKVEIDDDTATWLYKNRKADIRKILLVSTTCNATWRSKAISGEKTASVLAEVIDALDDSMVVELASKRKGFAKTLMERKLSVTNPDTVEANRPLVKSLAQQPGFLCLATDIALNVDKPQEHMMNALFNVLDHVEHGNAALLIDHVEKNINENKTNREYGYKLIFVLLTGISDPPAGWWDSVEQTASKAEAGSGYRWVRTNRVLNMAYEHSVKMFIETVFLFSDDTDVVPKGKIDVLKLFHSNRAAANIPQFKWFLQTGSPKEPLEVTQEREREAAAAAERKRREEELWSKWTSAVKDASTGDLEGVLRDLFDTTGKQYTNRVLIGSGVDVKAPEFVLAVAKINRALMREHKANAVDGAYSRNVDVVVRQSGRYDNQIVEYDEGKSWGVLTDALKVFDSPNAAADLELLMYGALDGELDGISIVGKGTYYTSYRYRMILGNLYTNLMDLGSVKGQTGVCMEAFSNFVKNNYFSSVEYQDRQVLQSAVKNGWVEHVPVKVMFNTSNGQVKLKATDSAVIDYLYGKLNVLESSQVEFFEKMVETWDGSIQTLFDLTHDAT